MLRQPRSLMSVLAVLGLMSGCGGSSLSGDSEASKEKKKENDEAVAIDAADPYVVTGAYLACDFTDGGKDVGCSLLDVAGERIKPTQVDSLVYSASVAGVAPIQPAQLETNKWGAVWSGLSQLPKTKFTASSKLFGQDYESSCTGVPCSSLPSKSFALTGLTGMIQTYNSALFVLDYLKSKPDEFCQNNGDPISERELETKGAGYIPANTNPFQAKFWQAVGSKFTTSQFTAKDTPKMIREFANPFCLIKKGSELYFEGSKCIVAGVRRAANAAPTVLVYKKATPPQAAQLQMIPACQ